MKKLVLMITLMMIVQKGWCTYACTPDDILRIQMKYCPASCTSSVPFNDPRAYLNCVNKCINDRCAFECNNVDACKKHRPNTTMAVSLEGPMVPSPKLPPPKKNS